MNTLDIVLINIICYMGGLFSGFGIFLKYKQTLLIKTTSHEQLQDLVKNLTTDIQTSLGPPVTTDQSPPIVPSSQLYPTAPMVIPPPLDLKEVVIRTT
mgnify:FL=1